MDRPAPPDTPRPRLHLSQDPARDCLTALEFGRVDEGQPEGCWTPVGEHVGILHDAPGGRPVGFMVTDLSEYDPDEPGNVELWDTPRFDAPMLGLADVAPNAIVVAARALFGTTRTLDRELFSAAVGADGEAAARRWLRSLQAGDGLAHYGLGYTLFELGRVPEAYRHLRHYCEIAPCEAWAWCWYGRATAALGEIDEAARAFAQAIELDEDDETEARELADALAAGTLEEPPAAEPEPTWSERVVALADGLPWQSVRWLGPDDARVLVAAAPVPVWVAIDGRTGGLSVQAQIGTWPGIAEDAPPPSIVRGFLTELDEHEGVAIDGDDLWLITPVTDRLPDVSCRALEALIAGTAVTADRIRRRCNEVFDMIVAPPDFERAAEQACEEL